MRAPTKGHAAQACIDRFDGKAFAYGKRDCVLLAAHLLRARGVKTTPLKGVRYSTLAGAVKALRRTGCADLPAAIDALGLVRIAPARAVTGDLIAMPSDDGCPFGCALAVAAGNGRAFGFFEGVGQSVVPREYVAAWRVP
jgi:hypothetical protein